MRPDLQARRFTLTGTELKEVAAIKQNYNALADGVSVDVAMTYLASSRPGNTGVNLQIGGLFQELAGNKIDGRNLHFAFHPGGSGHGSESRISIGIAPGWYAPTIKVSKDGAALEAPVQFTLPVVDVTRIPYRRPK